MTLAERLHEFSTAFYAALGTLVAGAVGYMVRTIFTNAKKVEALEKEIAHREEMRVQQNETTTLVLERIEKRVVRMEDHILGEKDGN